MSKAREIINLLEGGLPQFIKDHVKTLKDHDDIRFYGFQHLTSDGEFAYFETHVDTEKEDQILKSVASKMKGFVEIRKTKIPGQNRIIVFSLKF
jgi:hypothetical protein